MKRIRFAGIICAAVMTALFCLIFAGCTVNTPATPNASEEAASSEPGRATDDPSQDPTAVPAETATPAPTEEPTPSPVPTADARIPAGTNVALTAEREVSSTTGITHVQWGWSEEYVNDGYNEYNAEENRVGWTSAVGQNYETDEWEEYVIFKLETFTAVNKVVIYPVPRAGCFPVDYQIDVSMNGKQWTTVGKVVGDERNANADGSPSVIEFETVTARYVRFLATRLGAPTVADGYMCQICEIEVYSA